MALTLLLVTAFPAIAGGLLVSANNTTTNSTLSELCIMASTTLNGNETGLPFIGMDRMMAGDQGRGSGGQRGGFGAGIGNVEVSAEYTQTVEVILNNDTDVQTLIAEGYNMTSIVPIIHSTIGADGTVTSKASTAVVTLVNGTSGIATVNVDIDQAQVTQIVILTRTVIDKTTS
jgi:hypothetical protein